MRWADAEGPSMRGTEESKPRPVEKAVTLADNCEAETELGRGFLPLPNQGRCPSTRLARRECEEKQRTKASRREQP